MEGTKGKHGGARPGAGHPVTTVTLKAGQEVGLWETFEGQPVGLSRKATIRIVHRNHIEIVADDGTVLKILR